MPALSAEPHPTAPGRPFGGGPAWLPFAIVALLFLALLLAVMRWCVNVPTMDDWDQMANLLRWLEQAPGDWAFWISQHNEARPLSVRLILLALLPFTQWRVQVTLLITLALAGLAWGLWWREARAAARRLGRPAPAWLAVALAAFAFPPGATEVWFASNELAWTLVILLVSAGLFLLGRPGFSWPRLLLAAALGYAAQFAMASGLAFWLAGFVPLLLQAMPRRRRWAALAVWSALAALGWAVYLHGYQPPPWNPAPGLALRRPFQLLAFVLIYLGNAIFGAIQRGVAIVSLGLGIAAVGLGGFLLLKAWWERQGRLGALLGWLALFVWAALVAGMTGLGRAPLGAMSGSLTRYTLTSSTYWAAMAVLLWALPDATGPRAAWARLLLKHRVGVLVALALVGYGWGYGRMAWVAIPRAERLREASLALPNLCPANRQLLEDELYPHVAVIQQDLPLFAAHGISFTQAPDPAAQPRLSAAPGVGAVESVQAQAQGDLRCQALSGWVRETVDGRAVRELWLLDGGKLLARAPLGPPRGEGPGQAAGGASGAARSWQLNVDAARWPAQGQPSVAALLAGGGLMPLPELPPAPTPAVPVR